MMMRDLQSELQMSLISSEAPGAGQNSTLHLNSRHMQLTQIAIKENSSRDSKAVHEHFSGHNIESTEIDGN